MADQGWTIDASAHTITFYTPPANGAAITVQQYAQGGVNATNIWALGAWGPHTGYPGEVEYFAGRLWFAGTNDRPQTIWTSKISNYSSFGKSVPTADDDAITATLSAKQVNAITDLLPLKDLVMLTTGATVSPAEMVAVVALVSVPPRKSDTVSDTVYVPGCA